MTDFWTIQNKVYAIAGTIVITGTAWVAVIAGGDKINDSINERIRCQAVAVAAEKDSINNEKRAPLDELILSQLRAIRMEQKKTAYMLEKNSNKVSWSKAEAAWKSDSLFNERYPTK
jgi:hypothetical protein